MGVQVRERRPSGGPRRRGWSVRRYMALFMVVLLAVAAMAAVAVRYMAEQDARQSALADANFGARVAATAIANDLLLLQQTTAKLAANPQVAVVLALPGGPCSLNFAGGGAFSTGHLDIVKSDGTVICSSLPLTSGSVYAAADWLPTAIQSPVTEAPFVDPVTGQISAVIAAPIAGGIGTVAAIVALAPVGPISPPPWAARASWSSWSRHDTKTVTLALARIRRIGRAERSLAQLSRTGAPVERPDVDGTTRLYARSPVGSTPWLVFAGADEARCARRTRTFRQTATWPSSSAAWASCSWSSSSSTGASWTRFVS